ncbi:hypothetical protein ACTPOE_05880 [Castellaniella sp. WN]
MLAADSLIHAHHSRIIETGRIISPLQASTPIKNCKQIPDPGKFPFKQRRFPHNRKDQKSSTSAAARQHSDKFKDAMLTQASPDMFQALRRTPLNGWHVIQVAAFTFLAALAAC